MRVAFTLFGGSGWTGGLNYLENLLSALSEQPDCTVRPVLFAGTDTDSELLARLAPYLSEPPILSRVWNKSRLMRLARLFCAFGLQRDFLAENAFRRAGIDLVFQHYAWYGYGFQVPTLAWIADFQHRRLPAMFSKTRFLWRDVGYRVLSHCATRILVSSQDARQDCESYYPNSRGRTEVLPFAVRLNESALEIDPDTIRQTYQLPKKFFFLPNQFWKHKNHLGVVAALQTIKARGGKIIIAASGNPSDIRHPGHPQQVLNRIKEYNLADRFILLGMIPYSHILPLMRISAGVINPSFCEGWSTTVEEAKAIGVPLILSDLSIHREQTGGAAGFFNPEDPTDIARVLESEWDKLSPGPRAEMETHAKDIHAQRRKEFAINFDAIAKRTIATHR